MRVYEIIHRERIDNNMNERQINLKTMCEMTDKDLDVLLEGLRKIDGFVFFVDTQFKIRNNEIKE